MKKIFLFLIIGTLVTVTSCNKDNNDDNIYRIDGNFHLDEVPDGATAIMEDIDYSKRDPQTVKKTITLLIRGDVKMGALTVKGKVVVEKGASLTITNPMGENENLKINEEGTFFAEAGSKVTSYFLEAYGNTHFDNVDANIKDIKVAEGSVLYTQNTIFRNVNSLILDGEIHNIKNAETDKANYYSVIQLTDHKFFARDVNSIICGPILFTDRESSGYPDFEVIDVTEGALKNNKDLYKVYGLDPDTRFYNFIDQITCNPETVFPQP